LNFDNVNIISFNDENGNVYPVRDIKEIGKFQTGMLVDIQKESAIDEIISRKEFYGDGAEDLSYQVVEQNVVAIVEAKFDIGKLKKIDIPVVTED
jgi:hypothetical protein